jgi:hypothetical protein
LEDEQLARRRERVDADLLHREADAAAHLARLRDHVETSHDRAPGRRSHQRAEHRDRRRLARAVRAQQPVAFARRDPHGHAAHRLAAVRVGLRDILDHDASERRGVIDLRSQLHELVQHALESCSHRLLLGLGGGQVVARRHSIGAALWVYLKRRSTAEKDATLGAGPTRGCRVKVAPRLAGVRG